jgi:class 3 adenylate cyclase/pimeloyl-ACP methyl ester carboxylesterase
MTAMEPRIQYAKTSDGVSIAFWTLGEGMPFVLLPGGMYSHVQQEWQFPEMRRWYEQLARKTTLVRYDWRGSGLSERNVEALSAESKLRDLGAVVDRLALEKFALFGFSAHGMFAIDYTVRHPERVSHLVLWCACARPADLLSPQMGALWQLGETDWELRTEAMAHYRVGWEQGEVAHRFAAFIRQAVTWESERADFIACSGVDVTHLLPQVSVPTLVIHRRELPTPTVDVARGLAANIPNARLVLLEGSSMMPFLGDTDSVVKTIYEFLGVDEPQPVAVPDPLPSGTAIILFADIVDSTALTERMGDAAFRDKARALDEALRAVIREHSGTPIEGKLLGDGVLAVFTSARQAIEAALLCGRAGDEGGLPLHLGIHAGDVIREGDNVYGGAVNIASRISGLSAPGEVLVSDTVRSLARTSASAAFEDRGEHSLKGVGEPLRVWSVSGSRP